MFEQHLNMETEGVGIAQEKCKLLVAMAEF